MLKLSTAESPLAEITESRRLQVASMSQSTSRPKGYLTSSNNYDENQKEKFELMNVKIVVYGLTGLVCEELPTKKKRIFPKPIGLARREMKPIDSSDSTDESSEKKALDTTTAVISCHKDGTSKDNLFATFLPSLPLGNPAATSLNKVNYDAAWPSEQSILEQDDLAIDRSAFVISRSMKQTAFKPGIGGRCNYCHQTIELAINISRGTELIRLGTALIVVNGEEEGEVKMNVTTTPFEFKSKKLKKKKNKYGYFSNDSSRRFYLDENSVLKVGVQVIPEDAMRFAREKEKKKQKSENMLNELLAKDKYKTLIRDMDNNEKNSETVRKKSLSINSLKNDNDLTPENQGKANSFLPYILCGNVPTSWMQNFFNSRETEPETQPEIPKEIVTEDNVDQYIISSLMSSVSDATDGSDDNLLQDIIGGDI